MRWRIKANGAQIDLPDEWGQDAQVRRVADLETYVKKYQRMPRVITRDYVMGTRAPGPRTPDEVLIEGHHLERMVKSGQLAWDRMALDEQLALGLATKRLTPAELTPEARWTLGLPLSVREQIAFGEQYHLPATERSGWMGLGEAGRRAGETFWRTLTAPAEDLPGASFMLRHLTPPPALTDPWWLHALKRTPAETVGNVERVIGAPWSAAAETFAGMTDAPGWIGQQGSRTAFDIGLWAPLAGSAVSAIRRRLRPFFTRSGPPSAATKTPSVLVPPPAPAEGAPLALPGQVEGVDVVAPSARTRRMLPSGPRAPLALPAPGSEDAEFTVLGETQGTAPDPMAGEGWRRTPGPLISPRRPPKAPPTPPAQRALPAPPPLPPARGLTPPPPASSVARAVGLPTLPTTPAVTPKTPTSAMGVPAHMLEPPPAVIPETTAKPPAKPRGRSGKTKYQHVDVGTVNLSDPDEVRALIEGVGGIRKADIEGIPWWLRGRGIDFDVLVADISKAQRRLRQDVARDLGHTLKRYNALKDEKRARLAGQPKPASWEQDVPDWVTDETLWHDPHSTEPGE